MARSGLKIDLRPGVPNDLPSIHRIQAASPEASQWAVEDYLKYDLLVAVADGALAGFAVFRRLAVGEGELLNLAVDPVFRRQGIGRRLIATLTFSHPGILWLEVRESNSVARNFYKSLGFYEHGQRPDYYLSSSEGAIVMNVHS